MEEEEEEEEEGRGRRRKEERGERRREEVLKCDEISYNYKREWLKFNEITCDYR